MNKKQKKLLTRIIISSVVIILLEFISLDGIMNLICYLVPYFVVGYDIIRKAFKGIKNKRAFDENFLMTVATMGAIIIAVLG